MDYWLHAEVKYNTENSERYQIQSATENSNNHFTRYSHISSQVSPLVKADTDLQCESKSTGSV